MMGDSSLKFELKTLGLASGLLAGFVWIGAAQAQEATLMIELNRVDQQSEACRFDWRITNRTTSRIDDLTAEVVLFDKAGVNIARMAVPFGKLAASKSVLRSFQLRPFDCGLVGEALANDVTTCVADPALDCVSAIAVSSKDPIPLTR